MATSPGDLDGASEKRGVAVVVGASGGIGSALCRLWRDQCGYRVIGLSRHSGDCDYCELLATDYSEASLESIVESLQQQSISLDRLVITNGMLSSDTIKPERKLADLEAATLQHILSINSVLPAMVLKAFWPLIRTSEAPRIAVLSARVGSIGDNQLGGWYAYRVSKAALNMLLRTAAIELKRINRYAKLVAYHPGTVDTSLSKPFQRNLPADQLLTPEFAANRLDEVLDDLTGAGELSYVDWRGDRIPW